VELLLLLLQKVYVEMIWGAMVAKGLSSVFRVLSVAGFVAVVGCAAWAVVSARSGKPAGLPVIITAVAAALWVISVLSYNLYAEGVRILMMFPAAAAVLIIIYFLYQRTFFYNAILTGGGLLALWLHRRYYMNHPRFIIICVVAGMIVLIAAAVLAFQMSRTDGKLGRVQVLPVDSNYLMTFLTCGITGAAMVLGLVLGVSVGMYLMYVLVGWLFVQAVFFTVKMM